MDWNKVVKTIVDKLPAPLVLIFGLGGIALYLLLGAKPPQVWPALSIVGVVVVLGFWFDYLERRRKEAESAATALRRVVEASVAKGGEHRDYWTRPMLRLPLRQAAFENGFKVLDGAISEVSRALSEFVPGHDRSNVRANIFLPTSEAVLDGDVCNLVIPKHDLAAPDGLQQNMSKGDELSIKFRPNEGATGRVFVERRAVGVLTHPAWLDEEDSAKRREIERWIYVRLHPEANLSKPGKSLRTESGKSPFDMSDFQNRQVAGDLTWIISMPIFLKTDGALEVGGVFNVDCLKYQLKPEQLRAIYYRVVPFAGIVAQVMQDLPTDRVAILRFRD